MKKRISPDLFRNSVFTDYLLFNNVLKNKNVNALLLFQESELKSYLVDFFKKFNINIININIIRSLTVLNLHFFYLPRNNLLVENYLRDKIFNITQKLVHLNYYKMYVLKYFKKSHNIISENKVALKDKPIYISDFVAYHFFLRDGDEVDEKFFSCLKGIVCLLRYKYKNPYILYKIFKFNTLNTISTGLNLVYPFSKKLKPYKFLKLNAFKYPFEKELPSYVPPKEKKKVKKKEINDNSKVLAVNYKNGKEYVTTPKSFKEAVQANLLNFNNTQYIGTLLKDYEINNFKIFENQEKIKSFLNLINFESSKIEVKYDFKVSEKTGRDIIYAKEDELLNNIKNYLNFVVFDYLKKNNISIKQVFFEKLEEKEKKNKQSNMSNLNQNPFNRIIFTIQAGINNTSSIFYKQNKLSPFYTFRNENFNKDGFYINLIKALDLDAKNNYKTFMNCCSKNVLILLEEKTLSTGKKNDNAKGYLLGLVKNTNEIFKLVRNLAELQVNFLTNCRKEGINIDDKDFKTSKKDIEILEQVFYNHINNLRKTDSSILDDSEIIISNELIKYKK